ncbi:hypothetical protein LCGC14_2625720, partial [marine sediment metagenome]
CNTDYASATLVDASEVIRKIAAGIKTGEIWPENETESEPGKANEIKRG